MNELRPPRTRRTRLGLAAGGLTTLAASAVVLLLVPATLAGGTITLHAPYKKATVVLTNPKSTAGCGTSNLLLMASFNRTTGLGKFSDNATSTWCTSYANNSGLAEGMIEVTLPIKLTTSGFHPIQATWITNAAGYLNLSAGTCTPTGAYAYSGCTRLAEAFVYGYAFLMDKTAHKKTAPMMPWPGNFVYASNYTSCVSNSCSSTHSGSSSMSFAGSFPWAWNWNLSMNASHKWALQMFVYGGAKTVLNEYYATLTGSSANAQLNSGTNGNDEDLLSVTIG